MPAEFKQNGQAWQNDYQRSYKVFAGSSRSWCLGYQGHIESQSKESTTTWLCWREITKNIEPGIFVSGDIFLLQIAVNNPLENAIKYSPKEKPVHISLEKQDGRAVLSITDRGPGIADSEKQKVFQKFYRTGNEATKRAKGTGLGLYLTRRIIRMHDGNITIQNNPGGGSIFVLSLNAEA